MSQLEKSSMAGCYYCKSIFNVSEITQTTDGDKTAMCPKCGIDSVLLDASPFKIDKETLTKLNKYWF